jgi:hypothetical protein
MADKDYTSQIQGAGAILGAYGTYQQGKADYKIGKYNALISERDAYMTRQKGYRDEAALRRMSAELESSNRTAIAKSGVAMSGSPLEVLASNAAKAELDAMNVRYAAETQAAAHKEAAKMARYRGSVARRQSRIGATAQLISGIGSMMGG